MGLNTEFMAQIAHSIREQIQAHQKQIMEKKDIRIMEDLSLLKKSTRHLIESSTCYTNTQIKQNYAPILITENNYLRPISQIFTDQTDNLNSWEPRIEFLDLNDIRKVQKLEDRKNRYYMIKVKYCNLLFFRYEKRRIR